MEEVWADIEGFEGLYQVSSEGRVRSLDREARHWQGGVRIVKGKEMKPEMNNRGYLQINLSKEGKKRRLYVHRLVWMTFNGTIPDGLQVNHIDEDKTNNKLENLNLMTPKQNSNWGTRNERFAKAQSKPVVAFDKGENVVFEFSSANDAGRNGFNRRHLLACCRGERKTHRGYSWKYKKDIENA